MPVSGIRDKQPGPLLMGARWAISAICEKREEFLCNRSEMSAQMLRPELIPSAEAL